MNFFISLRKNIYTKLNKVIYTIIVRFRSDHHLVTVTFFTYIQYILNYLVYLTVFVFEVNRFEYNMEIQ
jgi:hypothetical protein